MESDNDSSNQLKSDAHTLPQSIFVRKGVLDKQNRDYCSEIFDNVKNLFIQLEDLVKVPNIILIEGAPGIGKTILCKEIAMHWVYSTILSDTKLLFLIFISDPQVKNINSILFLVNYFYKNDALSGIVTDWLIETDGEYLTIVVDGYDKIYQENVITDLINRKLLPKCGLVITSRPGASSHICNNVDCRIEMLYFSECNRQNFIQYALRDEQSHQIKKIENFLQSNVCIDALCCIPLNLNLLLTLIDSEDIINDLPKTEVTLYEIFIIKTITHFLQANNEDVSLLTVSCLVDLPQPYYQFVMELCQFAFLALQNHELVFSLSEFETACPKLSCVYKNGLGLLKPTPLLKLQEHFKQKTLQFIYIAIQEYMAAYYIALLPDQEQTEILSTIFWKTCYFNTVEKYFSITNGKTIKFNFLLGKHSQLHETSANLMDILNNKTHALHLLQCLREADKLMLTNDDIFPEGVLDFSGHSLLPLDIHALAVLLLRSQNKQWKMLNLSYCMIDDKCCNLLCEMLNDSKSSEINIDTVNIACNIFNNNTLAKLFDILKQWKINDLTVSACHILNSELLKMIDTFTNAMANATMQNKETNLLNGKLSINYITAQNIMVAIYADKQTIKCGHFEHFNTSDDVFETLQCWLNDIARVTNVDFTVYFAGDNAVNMLSVLSFSLNHIKLHTVRGTYLLNMAKTSTDYKKFSWDEKVADYLSTIVSHSLSNSYKIVPSEAYSLKFGIFQNLRHNILLQMELAKITTDTPIINITDNPELQEINLFVNNLPAAITNTIINAMLFCSTLTNFSIKSNVFDDVATDVATFLSHNPNLQEIQLGENSWKVSSVIKIAKALQNNSDLKVINLRETNSISGEAADHISTLLSSNTKLSSR